MSSRCVVGVAVAAAVGVTAPLLARDAFSQYGASWRSVSVPPAMGGSFGTAGDFLPDGRIVAVTGLNVFLERTAHSGLFDAVGILDSAEIGAATDPSFIRVSPDGSTIAIGAGFEKPVAVFGVGALGTPGAPAALTSGSVARYFDVPHYDAEWQDGTHLALTAATDFTSSFVSLLDTTSEAAAPMNPTIISAIGGASGGVAFDVAGRLYTGNGFDAGPGGSSTGAIRAFDPSSWLGGAANFEAGGFLIGEILSASSLHFDLEGNLIVGGGDFGAGDAGYLGVVHADAIAAALAGMGPIDPTDPLQLRRLDPLGTGMGFFGSAFDAATGELFATAGSTWHGTIPAPAGVTLLLGGVSAAARRRRHA
jgi:hypothetical protein